MLCLAGEKARNSMVQPKADVGFQLVLPPRGNTFCPLCRVQIGSSVVRSNCPVAEDRRAACEKSWPMALARFAIRQKDVRYCRQTGGISLA
jgi:hypothetical protein